MPFKKGQPKIAGRKKGTPNVRTKMLKTFEEFCDKHSIDPLEVKFRGMKLRPPKRATFDQKMKVVEINQKSATDALPYGRPKLGQVEVKGPGAGGAHLNYNANVNITPLDPNDPATLEKARRVAFLLAQGIQVQKRLADSAQQKEKVINPPKAGV